MTSPGVVAAWSVALAVCAGCSDGDRADDAQPKEGNTSWSESPRPQLGLCKKIVFDGRKYVLEPRPAGTEAGVGAELGFGTAHHCGSPGASRVKIYSVNEQPKEEAITVSDAEHVWVYDAVR